MNTAERKAHQIDDAWGRRSLSLRRTESVPVTEWTEGQGFALAIATRTATGCFRAFGAGGL